MFKKIILLALIFSPLWYSLFIGYPVISDEQFAVRVREQPGVSLSKRCFGVGDFRQFTECFATSERISGIGLFNEIAQKTNQISPFITFLVFSSLTAFVITSIIWFIKYAEF